jgi:hypothetical protein
MGLHTQASFSAGELDPALQERITLEKFQSGLYTARNVLIGKSGRIVSRPGRQQLVKTKTDNKKVMIYSPPNSGCWIELGYGYVRTYSIVNSAGVFSYSLVADNSQSLTLTDYSNVHFETSGQFVYIFYSGVATQKMNWTTGALATGIFALPTPPTIFNIADSGSGTFGYGVDYVVTFIVNGQETLASGDAIDGALLPIAAGQSLLVQGQAATVGGITAMNVYRRPTGAGAYGFVGSVSIPTISGGNTQFSFTDYGGAADYTHSPPTLVSTDVGSISGMNSKTGIVYQQRLILSEGGNANLETLFASRPGYQNNFTVDYPLNGASTLAFLAGSSGTANILRMADFNGLVVFTGVGIFANGGALAPGNTALIQKGNWVIAPNLPAIKTSGGLLFLDASSNAIRSFNWSLQMGTFSAEDISVYSNHLFLGRQVVSWAFQSGEIPLLWVVFNDGTFGSLTYDPAEKMQAWTRGDSQFLVEAVAGTGIPEQTLFLVNNNGVRNVEINVARYITAAVKAVNTEADKNPPIAAMDSIAIYNGLLNSNLAGTDVFALTPVAAGPWSGPLTLTCGTSALFPAVQNTDGHRYLSGVVGTRFRFFDVTDGTSVDLVITARASSNSVTVQPSCLFPSAQASGFNLYATVTSWPSALLVCTHLNGLKPAVIVDGFLVSSPNNDVESYPVTTVTAGAFNLPTGLSAAIMYVGLPYIMDVKTLDIDTIDGRPVFLESKIVNKMYVKLLNSRGLYVSYDFPYSGGDGGTGNANGLIGMQDIAKYDVNYQDTNPIIGNRYQAPVTKRVEVTIPGDWKSNGKIALRQVDPFHFEILSIIPDVEDLRR